MQITVNSTNYFYTRDEICALINQCTVSLSVDFAPPNVTKYSTYFLVLCTKISLKMKKNETIIFLSQWFSYCVSLQSLARLSDYQYIVFSTNKRIGFVCHSMCKGNLNKTEKNKTKTTTLWKLVILGIHYLWKFKSLLSDSTSYNYKKLWSKYCFTMLTFKGTSLSYFFKEMV